MNILLSTSPHIKHAAVLEADFRPRNDLMYNFAPLCLLTLAAALKAETGQTVEIYDINQRINSDEIRNDDEFYTSIALSIKKCNPDVLGFMTECDSYHHILQICRELRKVLPSCHIMLGGPHATAVAKETMERWPCIDSIVLGEGEVTFCDLIGRVARREYRAVSGALTRDEDGQILTGQNRPLIECLDDLPYPAYELYKPATGEELFLEVGRGCPFQCTFCSTSPFWHRKHRVKSPERIVGEIHFIRELHPGVTRLHFTHDLFTANTSWVKQVCEALISVNTGIKWTCSSRIDTINEELLGLMSAAGCNAIYFGIESGSSKMLETINKPITFSRTCEIIQKCHDFGISPNAGLIVGFPNEDEQSVRETFDAYHQLALIGAKPLHLFSYCPFAQSSLYAGLENLECTGHFLDIPLSHQLNMANRSLVAGDRVLFGSYFKPRLANVETLNDGVIYAVDEFSILADALRPAVLLLTENLSMQDLFYAWIDYICKQNEEDPSRPYYRKYMGSPLDFCSFLQHISEQIGTLPPWFQDILRIEKKNFEIAARLSLNPPLSMATYRSAVPPEGLQRIGFQSLITCETILDKVQLNFDISALLGQNRHLKGQQPPPERINLVWQLQDNDKVSLVQVNDFIYQTIADAETKDLSVQTLLDIWINERPQIDVNVAELISDIRDAADKSLISIHN